MMNGYGTMMVNGWRERLEMEALARYVRAEHGPGTRVDFLYAEVAAAAPRAGGRRSRGFAEPLREDGHRHPRLVLDEPEDPLLDLVELSAVHRALLRLRRARASSQSASAPRFNALSREAWFSRL